MTVQLVQTRTASIIRELEALIIRRRKCEISRRWFLRKWGELRALLTDTYEYQAWRQRVIDRDGGLCRGCGKPTRTCHHKKPVARAPHLVLQVDNGELRCDECHAKIHPHMRRKPRAA